jgi:hypothetical protein
MGAFVVTYDLMKQGQNYNCLIAKLNAYPIHWHAQGSVWIIETAKSAAQIRDELMSCLDANDKLIVARLEGEAAWIGYNSGISEWLKGRLEPRKAA